MSATNTIKKLNETTTAGSCDGRNIMDSRVLVIFTGGTIGMIKDKDGAYSVNVEGHVIQSLKKYPMLHDSEYSQINNFDEKTFALPISKNEKRVIYNVLEYPVLKYSSDIGMADWIEMAETIRENYFHYDGFVVLHGTDTMAYTASALSFMMENLGKPVILTGSQIPILELRSDGRDNMFGAIYIAGHYQIPEVTLFFNNKLFRGNRCMKISSENFEAFDSPNLPPLITMAVTIKVSWGIIVRPHPTAVFKVHTDLNTNVGLLRLFPGITCSTIKAFLQSPVEGVVLQTYGAGNYPSGIKGFTEALEEGCRRGMVIVNCSQCNKGGVDKSNETGMMLSKIDVVSALDMTPEAALSKLSYVLSKEHLSIEEKRKMMSTNIRGEMSILRKQDAPSGLHENILIRAVADTLFLSSEDDLKELGNSLFPSLMCAAARNGDIETLAHLQKCGGDLQGQDYDGRTALHLAAAEGNYKTVRFLLEHGCSIYAVDRFGHTPFLEAVLHKHLDVIMMMKETGGHVIKENISDIATYLCSSASSGDVKRMEAFSMAGVDLSLVDYIGSTALHISVATNQLDCVKYLVKMGLNAEQQNRLGQTPLTLAKQWNNADIINILKNPNDSTHAEGENEHELAPS